MLKDQILKTIKYFDVQDHCLTLLEIHKYLLTESGTFRQTENLATQKSYSVYEILSCLEKELLAPVQTMAGFYFLSERQELASRRLQNNAFATPRLKRTRKYLAHVRHIPFIAAVALTGSEALNNSKQGSDIDLLVLTKPNRIWLGRIFLTAYFQIFGVRRHGNFVANRFCLNHYVEQGKQLDADQNIYTAVEYLSLLPYFGSAEIYEFQKKNMPWIRQYIAQPQLLKYPVKPGSAPQAFLEIFFNNPLGNLFEKLGGMAQRKRIQMRENIVVTNNELAFHPGSKGQQVLKKFGV